MQYLLDALVGQLGGRQALEGGEQGVAARAEKEAAGLQVATLGGPVQRCLALVIHCVNLHLMLHQHVDDVIVRFLCSQVQWGLTVFGFVVDVGSFSQQQLTDLSPLGVGTGGDAVQCGLVGTRVFEADGLLGEVLLHTAHVSLTSCLEQGVTSELICQSFFELGGGGQVDGTLVVAVEEGGVGPVAKQQRAHLHPVLGSSLVERCELPQVHGVHTRAVLD